MVRKKIALVGHFGGKETFLDGQTVKTRTLYQELSNHTNWHIQKVDTFYRHKAPWILLWQFLVALLTTKDIIIITSQNGRRIFFPVLYFCAKHFGTRVYHDVIGARLAKFTEEYPVFRKYLNTFKVNWVETENLRRELEKVGVSNAVLMPNFKQLKILSDDQVEVSAGFPYKLCTFSRVMKEKGIEDAIHAVEAVNNQKKEILYTLDIYGPVDPQQTEWFEALQSASPEYVSYRGKVHYSESVDTLKNYFALLFPTRYYTEGVPGTIIDAYAAGVPVIASEWESFSDVVENGRIGYGYQFADVSALIDLLTEIAEEPEKITSLKLNCTKEAEYYLPEKNVRRIINTVLEASN